MNRLPIRPLSACSVVLMCATSALAQDPPPTAPPDEAVFKPAEPDFTLVALPVHHTNLFQQATIADNNTLMIGLGARPHHGFNLTRKFY